MPLVAGWLIATALQSLIVESFRGMSRFAASTLLDAFFVDIVSAHGVRAGVRALPTTRGRSS